MGIFDYGAFTPNQAGETPDFMQAQIAQGNFENEAKARANSLRSQNIMGGAALYNQAMGENTPIADTVDGWMGGGAAATPIEGSPFAADAGASMDAAISAPMVDPASISGASTSALDTGAALDAAMAADVSAGTLAGAEVGAVGAEALAAETLAAETLGAAGVNAAGGAGGSSLLAAVPGVGWAALAAMALREFT